MCSALTDFFFFPILKKGKIFFLNWFCASALLLFFSFGFTYGIDRKKKESERAKEKVFLLYRRAFLSKEEKYMMKKRI